MRDVISAFWEVKGILFPIIHMTGLEMSWNFIFV